MKQLEKSAEKALEREEKLVEKILSLQNKYKITEARFEYGEITSPSLTRELMTLRMRSTERSSRSKSVPMSSTTPSMTCLPTTNSPKSWKERTNQDLLVHHCRKNTMLITSVCMVMAMGTFFDRHCMMMCINHICYNSINSMS